ncbi:MAG: DEAD/DEAH box helicase [Deltaproteobacteria bacterium]|nr:DEAD/DEAH box helicase [Deltaproteobacteria bacterium]
MSFEELGAHPALRRALEARGWTAPTPVQAAVLDPALAARDLLVSAETGSGKTAAFGLCLAPTLLGQSERLERVRKPRWLVLAPTRELALQVQRELAWLYAEAGLRSVACVGGMPIVQQFRALHEGVHLVVGTPGRVVDHLERHSLVLDELQAVVLDEADEMMDLGFRDEIERILGEVPPVHRGLWFSATLPAEVVELSRRFLKDPARVAATPPREAHRDIRYVVHPIAEREREHAVVNVLRSHAAPGAIVFCATRDEVNRMQSSLRDRGFRCVGLSGELSQPERTRALQLLRDGHSDVLVATDVAARGLDLPDVSLVIHADLPRDFMTLQHRSGRTGRAGRKGTAVLLAPPSRRFALTRMLRAANVRAEETRCPTAEAIVALDQDRLVERLSALEAEPSEEDREVARRLLAARDPLDLVAALVTRSREAFPEPEELPLTRALEARPGPRPPPQGSAPYAPSAEGDHWFILNVGRVNRADPRWLIPILCRWGGLRKEDIGTIQVLERETRFEVHPKVARLFKDRVQVPDRVEKNLRIEQAADLRARSLAHRPRRNSPR